MWLKCENGSWINSAHIEQFDLEQVIHHKSDGTFTASGEYKITARRTKGAVITFQRYESKPEAEKHLYYLVRMLTRELHGEKVSDDDLA